MKVLAAVVTHNRRELLGRCLDHLAAQQRAPDDVVVIDNDSSDGTAQMLEQRGVRTIRQANLGSAGGWRRAIADAEQRGFDAIWLMDDDGFPDSAALGKLVAALKPGIAAASSVVVQENAPDRFVFPFPRLNARGFPVTLRPRRKIAALAGLAPLAADGTYPFAHLFNGALIPLSSIGRIGNVDEGFFMFGDEVDFFCRLRKVGPVISVLGALHYHPDVSARPYSPMKVYYYVKNSIALHNRYFDQAPLRNAMALVAVIARVARRNGLAAALRLLAGRDAPSFYGAIVRGLRGQIGRDFDG
jgi:GT2 family glycosyltransferase